MVSVAAGVHAPPARDRALELRRHLRDHAPFWPLERGGDPLLFRGNRPRRCAETPSTTRRGPALEAAGLAPDRYVFHSLRHWCASSLLAAGAPITAVAGHFGDVPETVMRTYGPWLRDENGTCPLPCSTRCSRTVAVFEVAKSTAAVRGESPKWVTVCRAYGAVHPAGSSAEAEKAGARAARRGWCAKCAKAAK